MCFVKVRIHGICHVFLIPIMFQSPLMSLIGVPMLQRFHGDLGDSMAMGCLKLPAVDSHTPRHKDYTGIQNYNGYR